MPGALDAARSLLFVPACDAGAIAGALRSEADVVVVDLEDLTPADRKDRARRDLPGVVSAPRAAGAIALRVNVEAEALCAADLAVMAQLPVDLLLVPKASLALLERLDALDVPVVAIIETASALREAYEIGSTLNVAALALGANDLAASLGLGWPLAQDALAYARAKVTFDSAAAGLRAPFDRVTPSRGDGGAVRADADVARELGFGGKACTRPADAAVINASFAVAQTSAGAPASS